jgi:transposase-like protein
VLAELGVVEQRYRAVLEVLDEGPSVTDVARRYGVARQTVHGWLCRYANDGGLGGLADRSSRPESCPHQMPPQVEGAGAGDPPGAPVVPAASIRRCWPSKASSQPCTPRPVRRRFRC